MKSENQNATITNSGDYNTTIKQVAEAENVHPVSIMRLMNKDFKDKYTIHSAKGHHKTLINDKGVSILEHHKFKRDRRTQTRRDKRESQKEDAYAKKTGNYMALKTKVDDLEKELSDKDQTINATRNELTLQRNSYQKQLKALNQHLSETERNVLFDKKTASKRADSYEAKIRGLNKQLKELPRASASSTSSSSPQPKPQHKSLWQRIFGK